MAARRGTLGIVREAYSKWERRAPLTPSHVARLVEAGTRVLVQPCDRRVFSNAEYSAAGAELSDDLGDAAAIFGVKQVPIEQLLPGRAYMFFSHTIKAQPENMPLLDAILAKNIRLFDYECITRGGVVGAPRTVAFGAFAGRAGMVGGLRGLGERALSLGYHTPFLSTGSAYMYPDLQAAQAAVSAVGDSIRTAGLPAALAPFVVTFTGDGAASKGAREVFELLPHTYVEPHELPTLPADPHQVYGCVVTEEHMVAHKAAPDKPFDKKEYYDAPHNFEPIFHSTVAPYSSAVVHCSYWDSKYPRLLTKAQLRALRAGGNTKLLGVVDISCDIGGAFEMLTHSTYPEAPYYLYDETTDAPTTNLDGPDGLLMCGVDILPSELPREASAHFGDALLAGGFAAALADLEPSLPWAEAAAVLPAELVGACLVSDGALVDGWTYIDQMRESRERSEAELRRQTSVGSGPAHTSEELAGSTVLQLSGHLFDSNLLSSVLDLIEARNANFAVVGMNVKPNQLHAANHSDAHIQISAAGGRAGLDTLLEDINVLAGLKPAAEAKVREVADFCGGDFRKTLDAAHDSDMRRAST